MRLEPASREMRGPLRKRSLWLHQYDIVLLRPKSLPLSSILGVNTRVYGNPIPQCSFARKRPNAVFSIGTMLSSLMRGINFSGLLAT